MGGRGEGGLSLERDDPAPSFVPCSVYVYCHEPFQKIRAREFLIPSFVLFSRKQDLSASQYAGDWLPRTPTWSALDDHPYQPRRLAGLFTLLACMYSRQTSAVHKTHTHTHTQTHTHVFICVDTRTCTRLSTHPRTYMHTITYTHIRTHAAIDAWGSETGEGYTR